MLNLKSKLANPLVFSFLFLAFGLSYGAGNDPSEAGVSKSPLHIYSGGVGAGAFYSLNEELRNDFSEQSFKISQTNLLNVKNNLGLFIDADMYFPDFSWGANLGFDYLIGSSEFRPLIGLGAGFNHFEHGKPFGKEIGASGTAHIGFIAGLTEAMKIRLRVPYTFVTNDTQDQIVGLDISFLWSSRWSQVKKLNYK